MADAKKPAASAEQGRRNTKIGYVTSTKMDKTIVVKVDMRKAHKLYKRTIKRSKKFYAHDEQNSCRVGDVVKIVETRPMSKLKRWKLEEVIQKSTLVQGVEEKETA
jgi:small subunit ribosomal protein S17